MTRNADNQLVKVDMPDFTDCSFVKQGAGC